MSEKKYNLEERIKHLEFIQSIISRLSQNSFLIKGWALTIVSAIIAYTNDKDTPNSILIALIPILQFWILDSWFLRNERYFRELYDFIRQGDKDFNFAMKLEDSTIRKVSFFKILFNGSLFAFYFAIILTVITINVI